MPTGQEAVNMSPTMVNASHEAQMARWRSYLQDAPAPAFPRRTNLSVTPTPGALLRHKMALPQGVSVEISKTLVQLAWCLVSVFYSDTDDVVVGLAVMDEEPSSQSSSDSDSLWSGDDSDAQSTHSASATATALPFRFIMTPTQTIKSCIDEVLSHDLPHLACPSSGNLSLPDIAGLGPDMANATLFENQLVIYTTSNTSTASSSAYEVQLDRAVNIECTLSRTRATIQAFYDDSILSRAEMQGVLHTFEHVFAQITSSYLGKPSAPKTLDAITLISPRELSQVVAWNKDLPLTVTDTKHGMISRQAQATPEHEAICAENLSLSYAQLDTLSTNLAHHLITRYSIKPGQIIPFMFEKSPWTIPTLLAIIKTGAAFAPLDPTHTWSDTSGILSTCEASLVCCSPLHSSRFESNNFPHLIITPQFLSSLPAPRTPLRSDLATPSSVAYVIFTSGSTGKPKGIKCSHSAWVTHTHNHGPFEFHSPETRILQFSAYTWDVSISDIFTTLALGGTICVPTEHDRLNDLSGAFARLKANHIVVTPTVGQFLRPEQYPGLKTLVTIGEQMPQDFVTIWGGKVNLVNAYGPSETISRCCCATKQPGDLAANIGTNNGAALWVTMSNDPSRLVPIGAIGELVVEGPILADGYLKNPAKTAEAFISPPNWLRGAYPDRLESTNRPGQEKVIYRTGDLVRQLFDGTYSYIGRRDTQIKVHGVRLEAGHIEAKIRPQLPEDADLVVDKIYVGRDETKLKQMLAAFVTFPQFGMVDRERKHGVQLLSPTREVVEFCAGLHKYLVGALPSYMVPNYILPVSMICLGATGKVNRRGLQAFARGVKVEELNAFKVVETSGGEGEGRKEKPRGETEREMARLWGQVIDLDVESIGREDSFFSLGGDSVSGMRLVSEAAKVGLVLSVADIFQFSVLHELAAFVAGGEGEVTKELEEIEAFALIGGLDGVRKVKDELKRGYKMNLRAIEDVYPATPMQEGMMAESIATPEVYILQEVLKLSSKVDEERLEEALQDMVDAYPILRTRIVRLKELGTCQVVMTEDAVSVELAVVDNTDLQSFLARDKNAHMGFGDVLSRFSLVHDILDGNRYFVWTAHHAITDGHMNEDIVRRLEIAYKKEEELPKTTEFNQFIKLQTDNNSVDGAMEYWRQTFEGFNNSSHFPPCEEEDYEPTVTDTVTYRATLPREASKFTPSILLRAAWAYVLAQQASINGNATNDIVMGITQSGRHVSLPGVEECLGPCLVTIPVRVTLDMTQSFSDFLTKIQKEYIDAMPYQHTGLQHIRKASPECAEAVGFRNLLVVQPASAPHTSKLFLTDESTQTNADDTLNFGLFLECILSTNNTVEMRAGFDNSLLSASDATAMMHRLEHVYSQLCRSSNAALPLSKLEIVSPLDMATLNKFNPEVPALEQCMHWMIESQARRQPNALMVDSWDAQLSYRVANEYSDRLAGVLFDLGVRPETIVPFAFEKSAYATIAIHAILKAGGACVALDMAHPVDRHQQILLDTKARVIVTSPTYTSKVQVLLKTVPKSKVVTISQSILQKMPPRPASTRQSGVTPANPAWVVYSSGSTGTPKGTILEHRSLCSTSRTNSEILSVGPQTRAIHFASYSFDVAIEENTIIPMYGGCICIPSDEERLNDLPGAMRKLRVNWADLTPTVARMLTPINVPSLKTLVLGGEALTQDIIDTWATNCDLFNTYGPSECSIQCTSSLKPLKSLAKGANIGAPVNCKLWVVDAEDCDRALAVGMTGELLIEGPIVGRGYLNRAEKTKEVFVENLKWAGEGRRFYRTGDLARFNADGTLDCLGRRDSQIKLNGQRVELGEIEYHIGKATKEGEQMIAVEAFTPSTSAINGRKLLAAFVQFGSGATSREKKTEVVTMQMTEQLRQGLLKVKEEMSRHVPEYMVPSVWVPLVNMPMNTSGKIDRKKLREVAGKWERAVLGGYSLAKEIVSSAPVAAAKVEKKEEVVVAPQAFKEVSFELTLANLWAEVLGLDLERDPIGEQDSFLELGGDSIAAMHLVGKAKSAGLLGLSVPTIMKRPTFGGMVAAVSAKFPKAAAAPAPVVKKVEAVEEIKVQVEQPVQTWDLPVVVEVPEPEPVSVTEDFLADDEPEQVSFVTDVVEEIFSAPTIVEPATEIDLDSPYSPFQLVESKVSVRHIMVALSANDNLDVAKIADVYPATPLQEGLMALTSADGNSYVLRDTYELPTNIDIARFKAAWNTVARHNAIFRTRVLFIQGLGTCQVVMNDEPAIEWKSASDLETYLADDRQEPMNYGTKLARFAIVDDARTKTKTFVWTIHHALYDGFSMALTFAAVDHAYKNSLAVMPSRPFVDFIRCLQTIDKTETDEFWSTQLKEVEAAQFPLLPNGHVCKGDNSMKYSIPFSADRSTGITVATILKAAWAILVSRVSDSPDVVYGVTQFGRDLELDDIETINGPTITTVPVRITVDGKATVREFLKRVQSQAIDMIPFSHTGLQNIKKISDATRGACEFQNLLVIQPAEEEEESALFKKHTAATTADYLSGYSLVVECALGNGEVVFSAHHDSTVISAPQVERLLHQFEHLLNQLQIVTGRIQDIDMFCPADRADLIAWNSNYPKVVDECVHDLIFRHAVTTPDAPAIASRAVNLTFKELDEYTNHLAHQLQALGVGPEKMVPICLEKSPEAVISMIAIQKAGGAYVPLNPADPIDRLLDLVDQVSAEVVIFSEQTRHLIPTLIPPSRNRSIHALVHPPNLSSWLPLNSSPVPQTSSPKNLAYALFTSGSTGRPKAVLVDHLTLSSSIHGHGIDLGWAASPRRTLQFASYTFDACIAEIYTVLVFGGCICIPTEHERLNNLVKFINDFQIDFADFTPSFVRSLKPSDVPTLKVVVLGGEAMNKECIEVWGDIVHLRNGYGPTETCVVTVCGDVLGPNKQAALPKLHRPRTETWIGHPTASIGWVVDPKDHNRLTPVGCVGELLIQGPNVARGYLGQKDKTDEVFVAPPKWLRAFGHARDEKLYKTGDLVVQDVVDGSLTYLGRKDNQTKVNGQRLELGEIETQLKAKGASLKVESAVVLAGKTKYEKTKQSLAAFIHFADVKPANDGKIVMKIDDKLLNRLQRLESAMRATLPKYMVPTLWIPVSKMPVLSSAKTDRKTLTALFKDLDTAQVAMYSLTSADEQAGIKVEAATDIEAKLVSLIAQTLGRRADEIGTNDSFFRLGGDSITAIQLVAAARQENISLSTELIFRHSKILDMAMAASSSSSSDQDALSAEPIEPFSLVPETTSPEDLIAEISDEYSIPESSISDIMPCTPLQEGLITLTLKDPSSYILREIYRLPSKIDISRFKAAWEKVVAEQAPILSTRIVNLPNHGGAYQVVTTDKIAWVKAGKVQEYLESDKSRPFGYGTPLARFGLVETQYTGVYFVWTMHHSVYDGWSRALMMRLVGRAYAGLPPTTETKEAVPAFNKFIAFLSTVSPTAAREFWTGQFNGLEASASFPRIPAAINSADFEPMLDRHVRLAMSTPAGPSSGITTSTLLKATYAIVLSRYTSSSDTLFGLVQSGRNVPIPGVDNLVGPTITTVPLRITVNPDQSVSEFLQAIQSQSTEMIAFEHTGLQNIARFGTSGCRDAVNFGTLMVIQPAQDPSDDDTEFLSASSRIEEAGGEGALLRYGMGLEISLGSKEILLEGGYDSRLMDELSMGRLLRQFRTVFSELTTPAQQDKKVQEISMLSLEDLSSIADMNSPATIPTDIQSLTHDVIHSVALSRSKAMAINAWDVDFTYSEVDTLSTKLAAYLRTLFVKKESIVPLCFEKSGWAIIAMLGVMKAGGAFVFLDPGYPMARLDEIVRQVNAPLILASLDQAGLWKHAPVPVLVVDNVSIESLPSGRHSYEEIVQGSGVRPDNALYLIFTSGSTGMPKGVVIEHHSFLTCAKEQAKRSGMSAQSRVLQGASYSFDVSVMEMLTALTVGACICVPNERIKKRSVVDVINDFRITWAFLTPSIVKFIAPADVPCLETLILGGEALTVQNIQTWAGVEGVKLINGYGPSECTIAASAHAVTRKDEDPANIGKALGGVCWIVEAEDPSKLAPLGTVGELLVEGAIVARGYLNNKAKTDEVFIEDPAWAVAQDGEKKGRRMYRTGDLAYFSTNGDIMFVGRKDAQVKVRGQRMELGEIETHLTLNKNIQHAVVAYPKAGPCKKQLVGLVSIVKLGATTNSSDEVMLMDDDMMAQASTEVADVTKKLSALVPSYMIPEVWIVVQSFPLLLSGKLNRKRVEGWLTGMDKATHQKICGMGESIRVQAPSSEVEKKIHGVWVEVLKMPAEEIGITQEFSTLGGDSILAMLVVGKLKALGFATVTMTDVANAKTISALAARIDRTNRAGNRNSIIQLTPPAQIEEETIGELFDLSPIQQYYAGVALGNDYLSKQTNKRFNHTFCLTVRRPLPASTVKAALEALITRHSMLRARFQPDKTVSCGWKQYISSDITGSLRFASWEEASLEQVKPVVEQARLGLDIENGPLVSVDLITAPNFTEQHLMIVAHHLVVDLVSWNIILSDLESYIATGSFVSSPPAPFSVWLKAQQSHAALNFTPEKSFPLRSLPRPNFSYWDMSPATKINIIRDETTHTITLSEKDTSTLLTTTNRLHGAEPMDILVSSLSHAFSYVFRDRPTPTIFRYGHGREQLSQTGPDPSGTVGWFTTFSPLHVSVRGRDGSLSVLQRTVDLRRKLPHNGLAYFASRYFNAQGKKAFSGERSAHNPDLMEVTVNYLGNSDNQARGAQSSGKNEEEGPLFDMSSAIEKGLSNEGQEVKEFSLFSITAEVRQGKLVVNCQWNSKMDKQDAIQKWWYEYENALRDVAYQVRKAERGGNALAPAQLRVPGPKMTTPAQGQTVTVVPPERSNRRPSISVTAPPAEASSSMPVVANGKQKRQMGGHQRLPSFSFSEFEDGTRPSSFERQMGQVGVVGGSGNGDGWEFL
ncbi:hypothetical protein V8F06_013547 [Rhypophila decipiens]